MIFSTITNLFFPDGPDNSIDRTKACAKLLAHLISMPVQLKDLRINTFRWLLHVVEYVSMF
jgi:hypothetical protein